jgi:hypothetical protein
LNADFDTEPRVEVSLKGCRIVNAIMNRVMSVDQGVVESDVVAVQSRNISKAAAAPPRETWLNHIFNKKQSTTTKSEMAQSSKQIAKNKIQVLGKTLKAAYSQSEPCTQRTCRKT